MPTFDATVSPGFVSRRVHYASPEGDITDIFSLDSAYRITDSFVVGGGLSYVVNRYIEYPAGVYT